MFVRNNKGSVLVIVLVVILSLTILGVTLGSLAVNDQRQAARQQRNNQALYLARSGAEATAALLLSDQGNICSYIGQEDSSELEDGSFSVKVIEGPNNSILIQSTGYVGDYSQSITLSLVAGGYSPAAFPIFDLALFTDGQINLSAGASISGSIGTNTTQPGGIKFSGGARIRGNCYIGPGGDIPTVFPNYSNWVEGMVANLQAPRTYPMPDFPDYPSLPQRSNIKTNWDNPSPTISADGQYDTITIDQNYKLVIDVGPAGTVRKVRVRKFNGAQGKVELVGEGRLLLYVEEEFFMKGYFNGLGYSDHGDPNQALIYYKGSGNLAFTSETQVYASLFAKFNSNNAKLTLGGGGDIYGSVFTNAKDVLITGGSSENYVRVFYAPFAKLQIDSGGAVYGAVVADTYTSSGAGKIEYNADIDKVWELVPEIVFEDYEGDSSSEGYTRGYWSN